MKKSLASIVALLSAVVCHGQVPMLITFTNAPLVTASSAYSSGMCVGGVFTFGTGGGTVRTDNGTGWLEALRIRDTSAQASNLQLLIFGSDPVVDGWTLTDHAAVAAPTVTNSVPQIVSILSTDWITVGASKMVSLSNLHIPIDSRTGSSRLIYFAIQTTSTPTYATTNALRLRSYFSY